MTQPITVTDLYPATRDAQGNIPTDYARTWEPPAQPTGLAGPGTILEIPAPRYYKYTPG